MYVQLKYFQTNLKFNLFLLRDEVAEDPQQSHGSEEDALHQPLELEVTVLRVGGQVEIDSFVHLTPPPAVSGQYYVSSWERGDNLTRLQSNVTSAALSSDLVLRLTTQTQSINSFIFNVENNCKVDRRGNEIF